MDAGREIEELRLTEFSIKTFDQNMNCEECGIIYGKKYNFCMIKCCGEKAKRVCSFCNWKSTPCCECKEKNIGDIIIKKKQLVCCCSPNC